MEVKLSIIILNYNARDYLKACIKSIKSSKVNFNYEIILVDNVSTDGSREDIEKVYSLEKDIKVVLNNENSGFSKGNNLGVKKSLGKYLLFLNPDTVVSSNVLQEIYDYMDEHADVGLASPGLVLETGELDSVSHRGYPTPWNAFCHFIGLRGMFPKSKMFAGYTMGWLLDDKNPHEVEVISGAFFFIRRDVGDRLGWWDEDYFMYGEDIDFCYQIKELGYKVIFIPKLSVLHYGGVSAGIRRHIRGKSSASTETRLRAVNASIKAMRIFFNKHYRTKYSLPVRMLIEIGIFILEQIRFLQIRLGDL